MDKSKETLFELIGGIVMLTLIELAIITIFEIGVDIFLVKGIGELYFGGILGAIIAVVWIKDMYRVLGNALCEGEEAAEGMVRKGALIRYAVFFMLIVLLNRFLKRYINMYMLFLSIMNLKFAVYLQPFTNKYITKIYKRKVRKC